MKSLFIAILLASTTSQAQTPPLAYPDLFVCDVKTQETDAAKYMFQFGGKSKGSSQQSSSKKEQLSEFVQKELFPSMIVSQFKFEKPLHIKGNTRGFDIDLDFSTNLTFSNELMYKLGGNAKISQGVYLVGKNSKILMHSKTYRLNDPSLSESLRKADEINEAILKDISSRMGTTFSETQVPRISTEVSFSDSTSGQAKPMRIRLVGTKTTQTITGVQLNGLTGSTLLIKVNGVNILLYSFHANLEFAASFNTEDAKLAYLNSGADVSGLFIVGAKTQNPKMIADIKALEGKICDNTDFEFFSFPPNVMQTIMPILRN